MYILLDQMHYNRNNDTSMYDGYTEMKADLEKMHTRIDR